MDGYRGSEQDSAASITGAVRVTIGATGRGVAATGFCGLARVIASGIGGASLIASFGGGICLGGGGLKTGVGRGELWGGDDCLGNSMIFVTSGFYSTSTI